MPTYTCPVGPPFPRGPPPAVAEAFAVPALFRGTVISAVRRIAGRDVLMAVGASEMLGLLVSARQQLLKHLKGLRDDQWTWKPYPECKSIAETIAHLISTDRAAMQSIETGGEPDYDAVQEAERDPQKLLKLADETRSGLVSFIKSRLGDAPLDKEVGLFGMRMRLYEALAMLACEEYYHIGQVAFIRMATDPSWDYYAAIYGGGT
ncbi:MAG: DinB family protein [Armatimonadota bacterium]